MKLEASGGQPVEASSKKGMQMYSAASVDDLVALCQIDPLKQ